jgi:hypothetical protein
MNGHRATWTWVLISVWPAAVGAALPDHVTADLDICPQVTIREVGPHFLGAILPPTVDCNLLKVPTVLARIKDLGVKTVCFPSGCAADTYDWTNPGKDQLSMDEFLDFCDAIGAEACYTLNMQGGTTGLEGAAPAGASLDERLRHRHAVPEGCNSANIHYGTLDEALALVRKYTIQRTLDGKPALERFMLGHENWRRAGADWPPEVYGETCEAYARAMLQAIIDFNEQVGELGKVELTFVMAGYPTPGRRLPRVQGPDQAIDAAWTKEVNQLVGLIDAVREPLPEYLDGNAEAPVRAMHELTDRLALRSGESTAQSRRDPEGELKYELPTEWAQENGARGIAPPGPPAATQGPTFAQQLCNADTIAMLLAQSAPRVYAHYLMGDDPSALLALNGQERESARVYRLLAGGIGEQLVHASVETAALNPAAPPDERIPTLSATTTRHGDELYVMLVNRSADRPVLARIFLRGCTLKPEGEVRTLSANGLASAPLAAGNPMLHMVPPFSVEMLRLSLDQVIKTPLLASVEKFELSVRVRESPPADTFTLSIMASDAAMEEPTSLVSTAPPSTKFAVNVDANWLEVSPPAGWLTFLQPQDLEVSYRTGHLPPGHYSATIAVISPDAYNSPQKLRVDLTVRAVRPDFDDDGDVDADDFAKFAACMTASPAIQASPICARARLNGGNCVDMEDYYLFESCLSGPDRLPPEGCRE